MKENKKVNITLYKWAGKWGPFEVKIPCGECTLTTDIITDVLNSELKNIPCTINTKEWLSNWYKPLLKGGWHAPIILVDGNLISQGKALNRGLLTEAIIKAHVNKSPIKGNHVFGKMKCPYCAKATKMLDSLDIPFIYHDVIKDSSALYEMIARVKPIIGPKTPVTVPQIWLDGKYTGGMKELKNRLNSTDQ